MTQRNYDDPQYKEFRQKVLRRDGYVCQWPKCRSRKLLRVHHIKTWAEHPNLRFVVKNGICLCRQHHDAICGREKHYERLFFQILEKGKRDDPRSRQSNKTQDDRGVDDKTKDSPRKKHKKTTKSFAKRYMESKSRKGRSNRRKK